MLDADADRDTACSRTRDGRRGRRGRRARGAPDARCQGHRLVGRRRSDRRQPDFRSHRCSGPWSPEPPDLAAPYVERYLREAPPGRHADRPSRQWSAGCRPALALDRRPGGAARRRPRRRPADRAAPPVGGLARPPPVLLQLEVVGFARRATRRPRAGTVRRACGALLAPGCGPWTPRVPGGMRSSGTGIPARSRSSTWSSRGVNRFSRSCSPVRPLLHRVPGLEVLLQLLGTRRDPRPSDSSTMRLSISSSPVALGRTDDAAGLAQATPPAPRRRRSARTTQGHVSLTDQCGRLGHPDGQVHVEDEQRHVGLDPRQLPVHRVVPRGARAQARSVTSIIRLASAAPTASVISDRSEASATRGRGPVRLTEGTAAGHRTCSKSSPSWHRHALGSPVPPVPPLTDLPYIRDATAHPVAHRGCRDVRPPLRHRWPGFGPSCVRPSPILVDVARNRRSEARLTDRHDISTLCKHLWYQGLFAAASNPPRPGRLGAGPVPRRPPARARLMAGRAVLLQVPLPTPPGGTYLVIRSWPSPGRSTPSRSRCSRATPPGCVFACASPSVLLGLGQVAAFPQHAPSWLALGSASANLLGACVLLLMAFTLARRSVQHEYDALAVLQGRLREGRAQPARRPGTAPRVARDGRWSVLGEPACCTTTRASASWSGPALANDGGRARQDDTPDGRCVGHSDRSRRRRQRPRSRRRATSPDAAVGSSGDPPVSRALGGRADDIAEIVNTLLTNAERHAARSSVRARRPPDARIGRDRRSATAGRASRGRSRHTDLRLGGIGASTLPGEGYRASPRPGY